MSTTTKLDKDEKGKEIDIKMYRGMIGSLLYLTASKPDIMFSVCLCARFQSYPKESHLLAIKRIFHYLSGTIDIGLWYPRGTHIDLTCYSDTDFAITRSIGKVLVELAIFLVIHLFHSLVRNKIRLNFRLLRRNMLPQVVVVHKHFG